jgi:hypothetical protein
MVQIPCKQCETLFTPSRPNSNQKFCSRKCGLRNWTENNREEHNRKVRAYRKRRFEKEGCWREQGPKAKDLKQWYKELKTQPCTDCGQTFPECCMDFDHREGTEKAYNLGSMFAHHYSKELIQVELDKCDLVCSNCHRIRTRDRRTGKRRTKNTSL